MAQMKSQQNHYACISERIERVLKLLRNQTLEVPDRFAIHQQTISLRDTGTELERLEVDHEKDEQDYTCQDHGPGARGLQAGASCASVGVVAVFSGAALAEIDIHSEDCMDYEANQEHNLDCVEEWPCAQ